MSRDDNIPIFVGTLYEMSIYTGEKKKAIQRTAIHAEKYGFKFSKFRRVKDNEES